VQQIFFRLVGILARTSPAGNAYAPLFFAALNFFQNPRADFCHIACVNCRERGATFIFSLRLLLDSGISVACSLRDRLPEIVTQAFPITVKCCGGVPGFLLSVADGASKAPLPPRWIYPCDATKWHETLVFLYTYRLPSANNPE
jgi:hypothetical protein